MIIMKPDNPVWLGNVPVGEGYPTVFVAEVGTFFNKDIDLAESFVYAAKNAGAQVFKTEILHTADVCLKDTGTIHKYTHATGTHEEDYRALVERKVVSFADYSRLFAICRKEGIPFIASVYDIAGIDFLVKEGAAGIKIPRDSVSNVALLRYSAKTGLPIIMDNGGLYFEEIAKAIRLVQSEGNCSVIVNHHPACNPAPPEAHNMRAIMTYSRTFGIPVGLACHYRGDELLYMCVGLGVNLLEKGVVDDPDRVEQDIVSALAVSELPEVIRKIRNCWDALGQKLPVIREPRDFTSWKCFVALRKIKKGETVSLENVSFAWPPAGIRVEFWDLIKDIPVLNDIESGFPLEWKHFGLAEGDAK